MMRRMSAGVVFTVLLMAPPLVRLFLGARVAAQDGKAVYERACAACHGDAGQGRLAPALVPFTRGSQELLRIVRAGAGTMMNGFSASDVSDADVRAIEQYLRSLGSPAAQAGTRPGAASGPVTFGSSAVVTAPAPASGSTARDRTRLVEWPFVGADRNNSRYSTLDDITAANVNRLTIAWRWRPEERALKEFGTVPGNFTSTPIMIDNVIYVTSNYNRVAALDAETGAVKWVYDPRAYEIGMPLLAGGFRHRGVAAWRDAQDGNKLRIFLASRYRLFSLDAETGKPVASFGLDGMVDTSKDLSWPIESAHFEINAAPTIYKDLVILGSAIGDNLLYKKTPPGDVRAYHARTGKLVWRWSSIPQSPTAVGAETWENQSWRDAGQIETWPGVTVDEKRGLVYLPTGNPGNLYFGGARPGDNLFAETLIALDAETGARRWHYQLVHHGLWDYSLPTQAMLMDLMVGGRRIEAVTQLTKHGFVFVFDRVTGQPVWPIEERPVPQSDVPGERSAARQPFPTRPPPVSPQGVTLDDAFDLTPELKAAAQREMQKYRLGPIFTPPSLEGFARPSGPGRHGQLGRRFVRSRDGDALCQDVERLRQSARAQVRPRHDAKSAGPLRRCRLGRLRARERRHELLGRPSAQQAPIRHARGVRHEPRGHRLAGPVRLRRGFHPEPSRAQGCDAPGAPRDTRHARVDCHAGRARVRRRGRPGAVRLRQENR